MADALACCSLVNCSTSAGLGSGTKMPVSTLDPNPQCALTSATSDSRNSAGARSAPFPQVPYSTAASTRSGRRAAIAAAI